MKAEKEVSFHKHITFCLRDILSDFRHLFNQQNFALFEAFIFGFIASRGTGTLTDIYQCSASETKYWSFPKFLSRGKWNADAVAAVLIRRIQHYFTHLITNFRAIFQRFTSPKLLTAKSIIEAVVGIWVGVRFRLRCRQRSNVRGHVLCVVDDNVLRTLLRENFVRILSIQTGYSSKAMAILTIQNACHFQFRVGIRLGRSVLKEINDLEVF